jgi:toxin CcdB
MAQFDVHATTGRNTAGTPYVVVVQSARYDKRPTRVVIPLVTLPANNAGDPELMLEFRIEGRIVFLNPLRILTVPATALGHKVASLAGDSSSTAVIRAIDEVTSRAYG